MFSVENVALDVPSRSSDIRLFIGSSGRAHDLQNFGTIALFGEGSHQSFCLTSNSLSAKKKVLLVFNCVAHSLMQSNYTIQGMVLASADDRDDYSRAGYLVFPSGKSKVGFMGWLTLLPLQEGPYDVGLLTGAGDQILRATGMAELHDHITDLRVDIDLSGVQAGAYSLGLRQAGLEWTRYPVRVF